MRFDIIFERRERHVFHQAWCQQLQPAPDVAAPAHHHLTPALLALRSGWPTDAEHDAEVIEADIENGPWPLAGRQFDAIVVTNYLWRPLWPDLLAALAPGGVYIHETFAHGNATVGKPSRSDFLLQPGELLRACAGLQVVAYEDGFLPDPDRFVQRIAAVRPRAEELPVRYGL